MSLKQLYLKHQSKFEKYLKNKVRKGEISEKTAKDYISALNKNLKDVFYPDELEELILSIRGDKFAKGLRNFFNFLEEEKGIIGINGIDLDRWRKKTIIWRYQAREIYIGDDELKDAY